MLGGRRGWGTRGRDAVEGKGPRRGPEERLGRRLEAVAKAVGGGYCRLQMQLNPALGVRGAVAGHRLGALEGGLPPPLPMHPWGRGSGTKKLVYPKWPDPMFLIVNFVVSDDGHFGLGGTGSGGGGGPPTVYGHYNTPGVSSAAHLAGQAGGGGGGRDASEGKGPRRQPQERFGRRLEEVAEAVGGGYCRFVYQKRPDQMFPIVNFDVSHDGPFGLGGGGKGFWLKETGCPLPGAFWENPTQAHPQ